MKQYVLRQAQLIPSSAPELWTLVLNHRTQILYIADIATICCQLELRPGSTVLESGTGSGSLTTSLARSIAPTGKVYTFEFHEQRAKAAAEEFERNGLGHVVTVEQRNIEELGFPESLHGKADAVFLDLPGPWKAVPSVAQCLKSDGVFCGFSPCIEQVQRTCEALNSNGFKDMRTMEVLLREYEVVLEAAKGNGPEAIQAMVHAQQDHVEKTKREAEERKKRRLAFQEKSEGKVREDEEMKEGEEKSNDGGNYGGDGEQGGGSAEEVPVVAIEVEVENGEEDKEEGGMGPTATAAAMITTPTKPKNSKVVTARPLSQGRGHTGYLTFARKAVVV